MVLEGKLIKKVGIKWFMLICTLFNTNFLLFSQSSSQDIVKIGGDIIYREQPIEGVKVSIFEGNAEVKSKLTSKDGTFEFIVDYNKAYIMVFSKEGMVTKKISINTTMPENIHGTWFAGIPATVFPACPGIDNSVFNEALEVSFDKNKKEFSYNDQQYNRLKAKMDQFIVQNENCLDEKFDEKIAQADQAMKNKDYETAKQLYQEASQSRPDEYYPKSQLTKIDQELAKLTASDDLYNRTIAEADRLFKENNYSAASTMYQRASIIKPGEDYPKTKVQEIKQISTSQSQKMTTESTYNNYIAQANQAFAAQNFELAKQLYTNALNTKPTDAYAQGKINESQQLLAQQNQKSAEEKARTEEYNLVIAQAEALMQQKKYAEAKVMYQKAMTISPQAQLPLVKISEIEKTVQQENNNLQIQQAQQKEKDYNNYITQGNNFYNIKDYSQAKIAYQNALNIKPGESYPKQKIAELDQLVAQQNQLAEQKVIDQNYQNAIAQADAFMNSRQFDLAKASYSNALNLKPNEQYPRQKIAEIDQVLAANAKATEQQALYNNAMREGDTYMQNKQYDMAKASYNKALSIKPTELLPKQKIAEADNLAASEMQAAKQREIDASYQKYLNEGDTYLQQKNYASAKLSYNQALNYKPLESYPKSKIAEIDNILAQDAASKEHEANYKVIIAKADGLLATKDYSNAKNEYTNALQYKPADVYAQGKINEINNTLAEQQRLVQEAQLREQNYKNAIANADFMFNGAKYADAIVSYSQALNIKPNDAYALAQIKKADEFIIAIQKQELEKQNKEKLYNDAVALGETMLDQKNYQGSKQAFQNALTIKPLETYPQQRIKQIDEILKKLSSTTTTTTTTTTTSSGNVDTDINLGVLRFDNESARQNYLDNLLKNYPEGVTLEVYSGAKTTINRYIIIRNGQANEFREARHSWGGIDYSINDKPITNQYFEQQIKVREGEYFKKVQK